MSDAQRDPDSAPAPPPADWGKVADGVFLAGLGVFFLLATSRGLPDGFWVEAISFWPILLVSWGIRIAFEKTSIGYAILLGPAIVLGALFWIAWGDRPRLPPPGDWQPVTAERPEGIDRARVVVRRGGVTVNMEARALSPGLLADGQVAARNEPTPARVTDEAGEATVWVEGPRRGILLIGMGHELWELGVPDDVPLGLELSGAAVKGDLDLRRGHVRSSRVAGAFNAVTVRLPRPSGQVEIRLKGAFNSFDVVVPEGTPVDYDGPGFPIAWLNEGLAVAGLEEGEAGYLIELDGAFNALDIDEGPAPEGGWREPLPFVEAEPTEPEDEGRGEDESPPAEAPPAESEEGRSAAEDHDAPPAEDLNSG